MSDFMAKMHQNRFRLGRALTHVALCQRVRGVIAGGAYSPPPDPLAGFKGAYFYGEERGGDGRGGERRGRSTCLPPRFDNSGYGPDTIAGGGAKIGAGAQPPWPLSL